MENRQETKENNFGVKFEIGQKFILHKNFGISLGEECFVSEISKSGLFFKVNISNMLFSIKTLRSKDSTYTSGYYLINN